MELHLTKLKISIYTASVRRWVAIKSLHYRIQSIWIWFLTKHKIADKIQYRKFMGGLSRNCSGVSIGSIHKNAGHPELRQEMAARELDK